MSLLKRRRIRLIPLLLGCLPLLFSTTCKKDYYFGTEEVRLKATLNNQAPALQLGDTLKVTLTLPPTLLSESGVSTPVSSVQQALYNFTLYSIDTLTGTGTRLISPQVLTVAPGSFYAGSRSSVITSTDKPPYKSVLHIVAPTKGLYYLQTIKGALKVNGGYESFLQVGLDVPDKHWNLMERYTPGLSTNSGALAAEATGTTAYYFAVR